MIRLTTRHIGLYVLFGLSMVIGIGVVTKSKTASALPSCFNSGNSNFRTPSADFPRPGLAKNASNNCSNVPRTTSATWPTVNGSFVYLSSYYANSDGSPGSTLHTPNASFILYAGSQPTVAQQIRVKVWLCAHATTSTNAVGVYKGTNFVGTSSQTVSFQTSEFSLVNGVYKTPQVLVGINKPMATDVVCKVTAHALSGQSYVGFSSDNDPTSSVTNGAPDKYNQNNWSSNLKATLGPVGLGAFALKTDLPANNDLEYSLSFKPGCTIQNDSTIFLKIYDADANVGSNPPGTINSIGMPKTLLYEYDASGALVRTINVSGRADFGVASGNDDFVQYPVTVKAGYSYAWVFWDIGARNGLQVWMPFDESLSSLNKQCPVSTATPSCSLRLQPINSVLPEVQQGGRARVVVTVNNDATTGSSTVSGTDWPVTVDARPIGLAAVYTNNSYPGIPPGGSTDVTTSDFTVTAPSGEYTLDAYIKNGATQIDCAGRTVTVVTYPYLRVYSGDVIAGSGLESGGTCNASADSGINAYLDMHYGAGGTPDGLLGSGAQLAAFSNGAVTGFRTNTQNPAQFGFPQRRVFANTFPTGNSYATSYATNIDYQQELGGEYGGSLCARDWFAETPPATGPAGNVDLSAVTGVVAYAADTSPIPVPRRVIASGVLSGKRTVYVAGDAFIGGAGRTAMTFNTTWATLNDIPSVVIAVDGDVYIDRSVTQIDAILVSTGTIYTCADTSVSTYASDLLTDKGTGSPCFNNKLTINGAVIAKGLKLWRTGGTIANSLVGESYVSSVGLASETIRLSPEFYLATPATTVTSVNGEAERVYDSITSLPPSF